MEDSKIFKIVFFLIKIYIIFFFSNSKNSTIVASIKSNLLKKPGHWRLLCVYDFIEETKATAATVTDGHCFAVRLRDEIFESVDNEGNVCNC